MALPPVDTMIKMSPAELDQLMSNELKELYESLPEDRRRRMQAMQWRITQELQQEPNQMARMVKASQLMYEALAELQKVLNGEQRDHHTDNVMTLEA